MYTIIYRPLEKDGNEILQILNGSINEKNWDAGDTGILYKICADQDELNLEANRLKDNWLADFDIVFMKKRV